MAIKIYTKEYCKLCGSEQATGKAVIGYTLDELMCKFDNLKLKDKVEVLSEALSAMEHSNTHGRRYTIAVAMGYAIMQHGSSEYWVKK